MGKYQSELSAAMVEWLAETDLGDPAAVAVSSALHELARPLRIVARLSCGVDEAGVRELYQQCVADSGSASQGGDSSEAAFPELVIEQGWVWQELGDSYCFIRTNSRHEQESKLKAALAAVAQRTEAEQAQLRQQWLETRIDQIGCCRPQVRQLFEELRWAR